MSDLLHQNSVCSIKAVCTTPWKETFTATEHAKRTAAFFHIPFVRRKDRSVERILKDESCEAVVVMNQAPMVYHVTAPSVPMFFHPNMAAGRIIRINRGEPDRLIECAKIQKGDTVVDTTLGLGADSLVLSAVVGDAGKIISLECVDILYHLFRFAKEHGRGNYPQMEPYLARIHVILANHIEWLEKQNTNSVDVVYFDPMFQSPKANSTGLFPLRPFASVTPISEIAFFHAKRIARKCVVLKERAHASVFRQFQLSTDKTYRSVSYGVWRKGRDV